MYNIAAPTKDKNPANTITAFKSIILNLLSNIITTFGVYVKNLYTFSTKCKIYSYLIIVNIILLYKFSTNLNGGTK